MTTLKRSFAGHRFDQVVFEFQSVVESLDRDAFVLAVRPDVVQIRRGPADTVSGDSRLSEEDQSRCRNRAYRLPGAGEGVRIGCARAAGHGGMAPKMHKGHRVNFSHKDAQNSQSKIRDYALKLLFVFLVHFCGYD